MFKKLAKDNQNKVTTLPCSKQHSFLVLINLKLLILFTINQKYFYCFIGFTVLPKSIQPSTGT